MLIYIPVFYHYNMLNMFIYKGKRQNDAIFISKNIVTEFTRFDYLISWIVKNNLYKLMTYVINDKIIYHTLTTERYKICEFNKIILKKIILMKAYLFSKKYVQQYENCNNVATTIL